MNPWRAILAGALLTAVWFLPAISAAADFQNAKLLDVAPYKQPNAPIIAPNNGYPVVISSATDMFTVTVGFSGMSYSANFRQTRDFRSSSLIVGDPIPARLDGDKLILRKPDGKEVKAKVTRRARLEARP